MENPWSDYTWKKSERKAQIVAIAIALSTKPARNCEGNSERELGIVFVKVRVFLRKFWTRLFLCYVTFSFFCSDREECGMAQIRVGSASGGVRRLRTRSFIRGWLAGSLGLLRVYIYAHAFPFPTRVMTD